MFCCCVLSYIGRSDRLYWAVLVPFFGGHLLFLMLHWFVYRRNASTRCNDNLISLCVYFSTLISKKIRARRGISKQLAVSVFFDSMLFPLPLDNSLACARNSAKWLVTDCVWYFRPGVHGILRIFPVPDRIRSSDDLYIHNNIDSHSLSCPGRCPQQLPDPYISARWLSAQVTGDSQQAQLQARPSGRAGQQAIMSSKDYASFSGQI